MIHDSCNNKGLTLIELLVVILIVGILAAIAIPAYTSYLQRARRSDGKTALEQLRAAQEMFRAERGRYANNGDDGNALTALQNTCGAPASPAGYYNISFAVANRNSFSAEAQAFGRQQGDGSLFINHRGDKWDSDNVFYPQGKWAK